MSYLCINYFCKFKYLINIDDSNDNIIDYINHDWKYIKYIPTKRWTKELALLTIQISGINYKYIPKNYKNDIDIIITSLKINGNNFEFISSYLNSLTSFNSYNIIKNVISKNGDLFQFIDLQYRNNYDIALIAINHSGNAWFYISDKLKQNINLLKLAICKTPYIINDIMLNIGYFDLLCKSK